MIPNNQMLNSNMANMQTMMNMHEINGFPYNFNNDSYVTDSGNGKNINNMYNNMNKNFLNMNNGFLYKNGK
jgi:hypothetical protein